MATSPLFPMGKKIRRKIAPAGNGGKKGKNIYLDKYSPSSPPGQIDVFFYPPPSPEMTNSSVAAAAAVAACRPDTDWHRNNNNNSPGTGGAVSNWAGI